MWRIASRLHPLANGPISACKFHDDEQSKPDPFAQADGVAQFLSCIQDVFQYNLSKASKKIGLIE
jgi:hypothetical protein